MRYLVTWSGGLDSTFLVWKLLQDGHDVTTVYFEIANNAQKTKMEKITCAALAEQFKPYRFKQSSMTMKIDLDNWLLAVPQRQMPIWILGLLYSAGPSGDCWPSGGDHGFDRVALGFIAGDEGSAWIPELTVVWDSYAALCSGAWSKQPPKIEFPISKWTKMDILGALPKEISRLVWWCENPMEQKEGPAKPCGQCGPCKRRIRLEEDGGRPRLMTKADKLEKLAELPDIQEAEKTSNGVVAVYDPETYETRRIP